MRLANALSLRSRRRKLRLLFEELRPTPATTVLDVGVDEVSLGEAGASRAARPTTSSRIATRGRSA
ncbi:MAG: hypothetical protein ACRC50_11785 [Gaiella sp.]